MCGMFPAMAQLQNNNWHFGTGSSLNFNGDVSISESVINAGSNVKPTCMSSSDGDLLFFSDGSEVHDANQNIMPNGTFSGSKLETLAIPIPGSDSLYYLLRSDQQGTDYSIIDMSLNDGLGDIIPDQKEIFLNSSSVELMSVSNATNTGRWLITGDAGNGDNNINIFVYQVAESGLTLNYQDSFYYLWASFGDEFNNAEISPDCSTIACTFKGHYFALLRFDNELGEISDLIDTSFDTGTSFFDLSEITFSPSSQYLYSLSEYQQLLQWDISSWDYNIINNSSQTIGLQGNNFTDLKTAPDGRLYLIDQGTSQIDRILNPDEIAADLEYENGVFTGLNSLTNYFPKTFNLACGVLPFFAIEPQILCLGDEATLNLGYNFNPDSLFWDFGDPTTDLDISTEVSNVYTYPEIGTFNVTTEVWFDSIPYDLQTTVQVFDYPLFDLGSDQTICEGEEITLSANDAISYSWNTQQNSASIQVSEEGWYWVTANNSICASIDSIFVTVIPLPEISVGADEFLCDDAPFTIEASGPGSWSTGEEGESIVVDQTGEYSVTVSNSCFVVTDNIAVTYVVQPVPVLPEYQSACLGDTLLLDTQLSGYEYQWNTGETGPSIEVSSSGTYSIEVIYQGCSSFASSEVEVFEFIPLDAIEVPNVFTPNGDNRNSQFTVFSPYYPDLEICSFPNLEASMKIYNRWGNLITEDKCFWDGRSENGDDMNDGVYYYIVDLKSQCLDRTEEDERSGSVTLLR